MGALSIVRFRTAVPETRDVAFVLAAVVVGMAVGAGQYWVSGIGLLITGLATQLSSPKRPAADQPELASMSAVSWRLTLKVGLHATDGWEAELDRMTEAYELVGAETARRGGALELVYRYQPKAPYDAAKLIACLNAIPAVESAAAKPSL